MGNDMRFTRRLIVVWLIAGCVLADQRAASAQFTESKTVERDVPTLPRQVARFDKNGDGKISENEMPAKLRGKLLKRYDKNQDQALDATELQAFVADRRKSAGPDTAQAGSTSVRTIKDIAYVSGPTYKKNHGKLDLYLPRGRSGFPVLMWVHGGGLHGGDKSKSAEVAQRFVEHGYGVVSVNYRLSPAVKFPAHIEDVARAFRWIYDKIGQYGGDRERLFVTGGSAGGHLTILLLLDESYLKHQGLSRKNIRAAIPISGLMDVTRVRSQRVGTVWDDDPETLKKASPLSYVRSDSPPILIMYADGESRERATQNRDMFAALQRVGHPHVEIKMLKDRTHNTIRPNLAREGDPGLLTMLEFLKKHGAHAK